MAVNPEAKLDDLKAKLKEKETQVGKLVKAKESLRNEIGFLEKAVREINQFSTSYNHALGNMEKSIADAANYVQERLPGIEAAVGDKKEAVGAKISDMDARVKKAEKELRTLEEKVEKSISDYEAAKLDHAAKKENFDRLKALRKSIEDKLGNVRALIASIEKTGKEEKEGEEPGAAAAYYLIRELDQLLSDVKAEIKTGDEYKTLLVGAWQDLDAAEAAVKEKQERMIDAREKHELKKKELQSMLQHRKETILIELTNI